MLGEGFSGSDRLAADRAAHPGLVLGLLRGHGAEGTQSARSGIQERLLMTYVCMYVCMYSNRNTAHLLFSFSTIATTERYELYVC